MTLLEIREAIEAAWKDMMRAERDAGHPRDPNTVPEYAKAKLALDEAYGNLYKITGVRQWIDGKWVEPSGEGGVTR